MKPPVQMIKQLFAHKGMRWAYVINIAMVLIALVVNHFLPHGWVAWPAVLAVGIIVMMNEAVDRNGQGIPPIVAYAWFTGVIVVWIIFAFVMGAIGKYLFAIGLPVAGVFGFIAWRREQARQVLIAKRRAEGQCIHCGEPIVEGLGGCAECGRDVDEDSTFLARIRMAINSNEKQNAERAREVIAPVLPTIAAQRKEKALMQQRRKNKPAPPTVAPPVSPAVSPPQL